MIRLPVYYRSEPLPEATVLAAAAELRESTALISDSAHPERDHWLDLDAAVAELGGSTSFDFTKHLDVRALHPIVTIFGHGSFVIAAHSHSGVRRDRIYQAIGLAAYLLRHDSKPHASSFDVYTMAPERTPVLYADAMAFAHELLLPAELVRAEGIEDVEDLRSGLALKYGVPPWFAMRRVQQLQSQP